MTPFDEYFALGDSMSIDRYPSMDLLADGIALLPHLDRIEMPPATLTGHYAELPVGAASLLASNDDMLWAEFAGRDLKASSRRLRVQNEAEDGATITDVVRGQLPRVRSQGGRTLVTLTVGGNDLLLALGESESEREMRAAVRTIVQSYEECVDLIRRRIEDGLILLTTVYDPSDGTGFIPDFHEAGRPLPLHFLDEVNGTIRALASRIRGVAVADVHAHFLGHGARRVGDEPWYWPRSMIEPSARGASEIRRSWLSALGI